MDVFSLPSPKFQGKMSLEETMKRRRTHRSLTNQDISEDDLSQLLWATYGINDTRDTLEEDEFYHRTVPSSGHSFPTIVYVVMKQGLFRYEAENHELVLVKDTDFRGELPNEGMWEPNRLAIQTAPLTIILASDNEIASELSPFLEDVLKYQFIEIGHCAQNLMLQATSLGLGLTTMTSFDRIHIYRTLKIPLKHRPVYVIPVGHPTKE
ncbi:MAG: hypothetical protein GF411_19490 [Candidatus Lokiarchaeota archaeon]|nr:hypothetical protein [Candidatus Lokiarchaeota archaeon]